MHNNIPKHEKDKLLNTILKHCKYGEVTQTNVPLLELYISNSNRELTYTVYEPSLCIILQGEKEVGFGDELYSYNPFSYLLVSTHIPARVRIKDASVDKPYVAFQIKFSLDEIYDVLKMVNSGEGKNGASQKGLFFDLMNDRLFDAVSRFVNLLNESQESIDFLSPMIKKEILYILISGNAKEFLRQFATSGSISNQIVKAINEIKNNFMEKVSIKDLATRFEMSETSFYTHFKTITSMSPIQFQKQLRLEEARRMLTNLNYEVSQVAFDVGYESPSQFSREFKRYFGVAPSAYK